jgi:hypothetical protein
LLKSGAWEYNKSATMLTKEINNTLNITIEDTNLNWTIQCEDSAGNLANSTTYNLTIDTTVPVPPPSVITPPAPPTPPPPPPPTPPPPPAPPPVVDPAKELDQSFLGGIMTGTLQGIQLGPAQLVNLNILNNTLFIELGNESRIDIGIENNKPTILIRDKEISAERPKISALSRNLFLTLLALIVIFAVYYVIQRYKNLLTQKRTFAKQIYLTQDLTDTHKINQSIKKFNILSEQTRLSIIQNKLDLASKQYLELLEIYNYLILKLNKEEQIKIYSTIKQVYHELKNALEIEYYKNKLK